MECPVCHQEMKQYKEEPCYGEKRQMEYRRTYYSCEIDDTWGRLEVPVGPIKEFDQRRAPGAVQ